MKFVWLVKNSLTLTEGEFSAFGFYDCFALVNIHHFPEIVFFAAGAEIPLKFEIMNCHYLADVEYAVDFLFSVGCVRKNHLFVYKSINIKYIIVLKILLGNDTI